MIDDSLDAYYIACGQDSDNDTTSAVSSDESAISPWRASSGMSPLRGRARMLSDQHRTSCVSIREKQLGLTSKAAGSEWCDANTSEDASAEMQTHIAEQIHKVLNQALGTDLGRVVSDISNTQPPSLCARASSQAEWQRLANVQLSHAFNAEEFRWLLLFDVLSLVRLSESKFCVQEKGHKKYSISNSTTELPGEWRFRPEVYDLLLPDKTSPTYFVALQNLLQIADENLALQAQLESFYRHYDNISTEAEFLYSVQPVLLSGRSQAGDRTVHGDRALAYTSLTTLFRLAELAKAWIEEFKEWVFRLQEDLMLCMASSPAPHAFGIDPAPSQMRTSGSYTADQSSLPGLSHIFCPDTGQKETGDSFFRYPQTHSIIDGGIRKFYKAEIPTPGFSTPTPGAVYRGRSSFSLLDVSCLPEIVNAVKRNAAHLRQCQIIIEKSDCFGAFQTKMDKTAIMVRSEGKSDKDVAKRKTTVEQQQHASLTDPRPPTESSTLLAVCSKLGAALIDYLIIQLSALQHPGTMELYRLYMLLLIHCTWPYILLSTCTIFGLIHGIDSHKWRHELPRLFRSSFSHITVVGGHLRYPTDVLSLILSCVDYQNRTPCLDSFKTLSALSSTRRFILCSFESFARQKTDSQTPRNVDVKASSSPHNSSSATLSPDSTQARSSAAIGPTRALVEQTFANLSTALPSSMPRKSTTPYSRTHADCSAEGESVAQFHPGAISCEAKTNTADHSEKTKRGPAALEPKKPIGSSLPYQQDRSSSHNRNDTNRDDLSLLPHGVQSCALGFPKRLPLCFSAFDGGEALTNRHSLGALLSPQRGSDGREEKRTKRREWDQWSPFWFLQVDNHETAPNLLLTNQRPDQASRSEIRLSRRRETGQNRDRKAADPQNNRTVATAKMLWLDTTIPGARWISAALLIPIGIAVQQLQRKRVVELIRGFSPASFLGLPQPGWSPPEIVRFAASEKHSRETFDEEEEDLEPNLAGFGDPGAVGIVEHTCVMLGSPRRPLVSLFTFPDALDLLIDIALCRDKVSILEGFLERLYLEPLWWQRTTSIHVEPYRGSAAKSTASTLISTLFSESLQRKRYGHLVSLRVLPKQGKMCGQEKPNNVHGASTEADRTSEEDEPQSERPGYGENVLGLEMLNVFASFRLVFHFPEEIELILLPQRLSVRLKEEADTIENSYLTLFWRKRRERASAASEHTPQNYRDPSRESFSANEGVHDGAISSEDVWSCTFGYLCALHFSQITLREHRKSLHIRDTQDNQLISVLGHPVPGVPAATVTPAPTTTRTRETPVNRKGRSREANSLRLVARSLGSSYYLLSFAVDTLLTFTQREVGIAIYKLCRLLQETDTLNSPIQLCQELDTVLVGVQYVCLLCGVESTRPVPHKYSGQIAPIDLVPRTQVGPKQALRTQIAKILSLALDPSHMPPKFVASRSRNGIEAIVALVHTLQDFSSLKKRLQPLLTLLTFNKFFGSEDFISFQFR